MPEQRIEEECQKDVCPISTGVKPMELCDYLDVKGKEERRRKANIKISNSAMVKLGEELVSGIGNGSGEVRTLYT